MNRRTRAYCAEHFVVNSSVTRPYWFDMGEEPEDSWRKQHPPGVGIWQDGFWKGVAVAFAVSHCCFC